MKGDEFFVHPSGGVSIELPGFFFEKLQDAPTEIPPDAPTPAVRLVWVERLIERAARTIDVLCDLEDGQGLSVKDLRRIGSIRSQEDFRLRAYARYSKEGDLNAEAMKDLGDLEHLGWEVKAGRASKPADTCVVVDGNLAMLCPAKKKPSLAFGTQEASATVSHFDAVWRAETEVLYENLVEPSHPDLYVPLQAESERWGRVIRQLSKNPKLLSTVDPVEFEALIAELLRREGFADVELTGRSHDGGYDALVANDSAVGQHLYLVECKRYRPDRPVGVGLVRGLYGVLEEKRATAALLVTTSYFTREAVAFREKVPHRLSLADYERLVSWLRKLS